ncbi:MAG: hypothetical protein Q9217_000558 [Psora testacea]
MSGYYGPHFPLQDSTNAFPDLCLYEQQEPTLVDQALSPIGPLIQRASNELAIQQPPASLKRRPSDKNPQEDFKCGFSTEEDDTTEDKNEKTQGQRDQPKAGVNTATPVSEASASKRSAPHPLRQSLVKTESDKLEERRLPSTGVLNPPHSSTSHREPNLSPLSADASQESQLWSHLPKDLRFYLRYHQSNVSFHHYFFKHDANHFFRILLMDQALLYDPLLYAVAGFAAFHLTIERLDGRIQDFLGYYNKAVSLLRESLASGEPHTDATVLTVLQLATFEEYLGDWVSLLGHQQAAHRMLLELYDPESIVENELRRRILAWYIRFDLTGGIMSGNETALGREWFTALATHYHQSVLHNPSNIDYKMEAAVADYRVVCTDMALLFAKLRRGDISIKEFEEECRIFMERIRTWHDKIDPIFREERYQTMSFDGLAKDPNDIVDPYKPGGLYGAPLTTFNFITLDWLAISAVFQYKMALALEEPPSPELPQLALEVCRIFEAIEYSPQIPDEAILKAQGSLGVASLFLPKDERHTMWCRRKLAKIEGLGQRMAALWGVPDINHWWLPNEEAYPSVVRSVRFLMDDRLNMDTKKRSQDQREIKGIFANLTIKDEEKAMWTKLHNCQKDNSELLILYGRHARHNAGTRTCSGVHFAKPTQPSITCLHHMAKLQAATVSNQIVPKRKRKAGLDNVEAVDGGSFPAASTTIVPTKTRDGGKRRVRGPRIDSSKGRPPLLRRNSSTIVETTIPWPDQLNRLAQIHRALNLVYTFCCTRKHLATTFENIKQTVEGHIKRELLIEDVARVKALVPRAINFAYVDESSLQVAVLEEVDGVKGGRAKEFRSLDLSNEDGVQEKAQISEDKELLLFEFVDGDLKRQVTDAKTGEASKPFRKLRDEDLKIPVYSQKQMMKLIGKRNTKFASAVNAFLNQCAADNVEPLATLEERKQQHIPVPSGSGANTSILQSIRPPPAIPAERDTVAKIIADIKSMEWYTGQIVPDGHRVFDPQQPIFGDLKFQLSQNLVNALFNSRRITQLYSHQAEAINNLYDGNNVIIATSTSSGKSLIYQIPMLHELERDSNARAMYIFPTKALAQDQRRSMKELLRYMPGLENTLVDTFDGDTAMADRHLIQNECRIIFTNPDMLHITILPQEDKWRTFLKNLRFVVVDELHVYNGLFGSHVALIMRRLRRICAAVGNRHVRFVSCSATVANPEEHMRTIFGVENIKLIDFDGSPSGRKEFLCWNTPFKDPKDPSSGRGDTMAETARLFCQLILRGIRVIAFCRVRKQCEVLITAVRYEAQNIERPDLAARIMGYRGGYAPQDRRKIEKEMFEGKLMGIVATTALELGVDIGSLDAVITVGFPYTIANLRQQSGRAGRRNKDSLSVLVGDCFATDQYYMQNPDQIFTKPYCELQVDLQNMLVLEGHIQCAAFEMPIRPEEDGIYFGKQLPEIAEERMIKDRLGFYHCNERFRPHPSKCVAIRDTEDGHFAVIDITNGRNIVLEEVEPSRAFFTIYEGGIFLHQGYTYMVKEFSPEQKYAKVILVKVDWTSQQRDYTDVDPIETEAIRRIPDSLSRAFYGAIKIRAVVFGFFKVDKKGRILDAVQVDNPPIEIFSKGMWLDVPKIALEILNSRRLNVAGAIHAAEHAILSLMPQFVISVPGDVRTECKNALKEFATKETSRKRPARLTFYDAKGGAGGSGISTKAFEFIDLLLVRACERVTACHCSEGCLECCCSEVCKEQNMIMSKAGSEVILKCLMGKEKEIDVESLPWGPDDEMVPAGVNTIVEASMIRPARGTRVEEVMVKRDGAGVQKVCLGGIGDDEGKGEIIEIKEEPKD